MPTLSHTDPQTNSFAITANPILRELHHQCLWCSMGYHSESHPHWAIDRSLLIVGTVHPAHAALWRRQLRPELPHLPLDAVALRGASHRLVAPARRNAGTPDQPVHHHSVPTAGPAQKAVAPMGATTSRRDSQTAARDANRSRKSGCRVPAPVPHRRPHIRSPCPGADSRNRQIRVAGTRRAFRCPIRQAPPRPQVSSGRPELGAKFPDGRPSHTNQPFRPPVPGGPR